MFAVTAKKAPFYHLGPMQGRGPDRELIQDTLVTVVHFSLGYSKVKLLSGETGFVANDDIARAPLRLIAQANSVSEEISVLPPTPHVELPTRDTPSPDFEPTPIPASLMPQ